jgi:hypothetical protein
MNKTILTLAALATIGSAALAPTSASAFGLPSFVKHLAGTGVTRLANLAHSVNAHPANVGKIVNQAIRLARPVLQHATTSHAPVHFAHNPVWQRPIVVERIERPVYQAPVRFAAAGPAYHPAHAPMAQAAPVNGMNVMMVEVPNGQYRMTGEGQWTEQNSEGKTFQFTEANRDESSVTLSDAQRGIELTLDLGQREVFYADRTSAKRPLYPIVNAAAK